MVAGLPLGQLDLWFMHYPTPKYHVDLKSDACSWQGEPFLQSGCVKKPRQHTAALVGPLAGGQKAASCCRPNVAVGGF